MKKERLESISALRALAFVGVFLRHVDLTKATGNWAVSVFIVMSGFLMVYNNYEKDIDVSGPRKSLLYGIKKIKKIYPLHVITLMAMFILEFLTIIKSMSISTLISVLLKFFLNLFLLHAWIPIEKVYFSINGVSWYLSTALFLYAMFPLILKILKKSSIKHDVCFCVIVYFMQIVITAISLFITDNSSVIVWITYVCPLFRLGDFFIGCVTGKIFVKKSITIKSMFHINVIELLTLFLITITLLFIKGNYESFALCVMSKPTLICLPTSMVLVYLFASDKSFFVKLLSKKPILFLGEISMNAYLIHNVVIRYVEVINRLLLNGLIGRTYYIIICFILTLLASYLYGLIDCKLKSCKLKNNI